MQTEKAAKHTQTPTRQSPSSATYSLEEFTRAYGLSAKRALELYARFGPVRSKLDTLMLVIARSRNAGA